MLTIIKQTKYNGNMKLSQIGFETKKLTALDATYPVQDILLQTGQLVQFASGIYAYHNVPLRVMQNVEDTIRDVFDEFGLCEISLPVLQTEALWRESGRWDKYIADGAMMVVETDKGKYGLAPTAEEAVVNFAKHNLRSHKSLPATFYQIGDKYRNEIRNRGYLLRGKAFNMMDAYSFDKTEKDMKATYEKLKKAYMEIFRRLEIPVIAVAADSGAIGGNASEEFMFIHPAGEDTIYIEKKSGAAYNVEVLEKFGIKANKGAYDEKRAIEFGHIFQLGTKYSSAMNANFVNDAGKEEPFHMGCYGIGVSRLVAMIYETSAIKNDAGEVVGVSLPENIAPYWFHIISSPKREAQASELYAMMQYAGEPCIYDDRPTATFGAKIADAKKLGTPYLIILGDKTGEESIEIEDTRTGERNVRNYHEMLESLEEYDDEDDN